jgi:hypothetical protein
LSEPSRIPLLVRSCNSPHQGNHNAQHRPRPADLEDLIDKEGGPLDSQLVLSAIANNTEDWEGRGPTFARRVSDAITISRDFWPVTRVLSDAARYRKLMQRVRFIYIDELPHLYFPTIPVNPDLNDLAFEIPIADAIDDLPDHQRW